jgi:hypothetical protein
MAVQPVAATSVGLGLVSVAVRIGRRLAAAGRVLWGLTVGLLFLLAFPASIVLAPLVWAFGKLRGRPEDGEVEADFP